MKKYSQPVPFYLIVNTGTFLAGEDHEFSSYPRLMLLAQVVQNDRARYVSELRRRRSTALVHVILDNGAYEGKMLEDREFWDIARDLQPDVIVLPDLPGKDWTDSRERSQDFVHRYVVPRTSSGVWRPRMMYCIQGKDREQIRDHFDWAVRTLDRTRFTIGLGLCYRTWHGISQDAPSHVTPSESLRWEMIKELWKQSPWVPFQRYHLLGLRTNPAGLYSTIPYLVGIDSYKVCRYALQNVSWTSCDPVPHTSPLVALPDWMRVNLDIAEYKFGLYTGALPPS